MIELPVRLHEGISLHLKANGGRLTSTLVLCRNATLSEIYSGAIPPAEAFRLAEEESVSRGFDGYYDVTEPEEWPALTARDYGPAAEEITRQLATVTLRAGSFGGRPLSNDVAAIVAAQQHTTRLNRLQDIFYELTLQYSPRR